MRFLQIVLVSFAVYFFSWLAVYKLNVNTLAIQSEDTLPAMFLPISIIKDGTFYIDKYYSMIVTKYPHPDDKAHTLGLTPFYLKKISYFDAQRGLGYHYISAFPVVAGILALPVYLVPLLFGMSVSWTNLIVVSHVASSLIVAFSGGFLFLLLKKRFALEEKKSLLLTAIYLFGTINYALLSQSLWQHGVLELFVILSLYFLFGGLSEGTRDHETQLFWSGLFMGVAVLSRPTAALQLVLLYVLIYWAYRANFWVLVNKSAFFVLGLAPVLSFFMWYNQTFYLSLNNQGYSSQLKSEWLSRFPEGFLGTWLSPSKGILIYSPVFIFALAGLFLAFRPKKTSETMQYVIFGLIVLVHTLVLGKWKHWYGGWSFGYRMSGDIIPYLVLLLVPYVKSALFQKTSRLFYSAVVLSVLVQIYGIVFFDGIWHSAYDRGFEDTGWLWSLTNSEFVFNVRRVLVKLGLLHRACAQCLP